MKKLAILYGGFVDISGGKGDAVHALELTRNLRRLGNRVIVVAHSSKRESEPDFRNTGAYEGAGTMAWKLILFAFSLLRARISVMTISSACDLLYMRDYLFCVIGLGAKLLYSKRIVWEVNGIASYERAQKPHPLNILLVPVIRALEMLAGVGADRIIAVSRGVMDVLLARGCPRSKVVLIENGVN
ncbi:MAG: glycosyltransferase family 4 protein, partial [bacterium]